MSDTQEDVDWLFNLMEHADETYEGNEAVPRFERILNHLAAYEALGTPEDLTALVTAGYASYACGRGAISYAELELYGWDADAAYDKAEALRSSK